MSPQSAGDLHEASQADVIEANEISAVGHVQQLGQHYVTSSNNEIGGRLNQFLEAIEKKAELSDEYWLSTLGISELQLREILSPIAESILNIINYLDSEGMLANTKTHHFDGIRTDGLIASWRDKKQLDSLTLLK